MDIFTIMKGDLSNYIVDWFKVWLNPLLENIKCYVCSPHLYNIMQTSILPHAGEDIESLFFKKTHDISKIGCDNIHNTLHVWETLEYVCHV